MSTHSSSPEQNNRASRRHFITIGLLVLLVTAILSLTLRADWLMPVSASTQAIIIDDLFDQHVRLIAFLFALIVVFMVYTIVVFRRKPGDTADGDHFEGHTGLEIVWTLAPLAVVVYFAYIGAQTLAAVRQEDPQALVVNVTSQQWSWSFEYPDTGITSPELMLPVNKQVLLKLTSADVIHSFWVPEFRVKQDALPGKDLVKDLRVTPSLIGDYKVRCAELCGTNHAYMENPVKVVSQADFDAWVAQQLELLNNPVERGKKAYTQFGCVGCHTVNGDAGVGPTWKGLFGKQETLSDGTILTVDEGYLIKSILEPNGQVVQGFNPNIMPANFGERISEEQLQDLIEYIKTLK